MLQDKGSMPEQQFMVMVTLFCQEDFLTKQSVLPNHILFFPFLIYMDTWRIGPLTEGFTLYV